MAVSSDGSYGTPEGLIFSFPITIDPKTREWKIVQGLELDDFSKQKIEITTKVSIKNNFKLFLFFAGVNNGTQRSIRGIKINKEVSIVKGWMILD